MSFNFSQVLFLGVPPLVRTPDSLKYIPIIVSFNLLRQAVQKGPFSISELVNIRFFSALTSFQLTLTGNNKSLRYNIYSCLVKAA